MVGIESKYSIAIRRNPWNPVIKSQNGFTYIVSVSRRMNQEIDKQGRHVFFVFFGLVDDRFVGFALDSRSLSVAAGDSGLDPDFGGDPTPAGLDLSAVVGLVVEVDDEAIPFD
jgi:hypothetical protein